MHLTELQERVRAEAASFLKAQHDIDVVCLDQFKTMSDADIVEDFDEEVMNVVFDTLYWELGESGFLDMVS